MPPRLAQFQLRFLMLQHDQFFGASGAATSSPSPCHAEAIPAGTLAGAATPASDLNGGGAVASDAANPGTVKARDPLLRWGRWRSPALHRPIAGGTATAPSTFRTQHRNKGVQIEKTALCPAGHYCQCRSR